MPCYHPVEIRITPKGATQQSSYEQVVPCGNCIGCRTEQSRQWAVRMMHEAREHKHKQFITLTIDDKHLNENAELSPKDLSRFFRNLRKEEERTADKQERPPKRISYYGCGEYGERTSRPHYHALLFGTEFLDRDIGFDSSRPLVWRSETLERIWGRGATEGGAVSMASASYVSGYMRKKVKAKYYQHANKRTGVLKQPEFARMSLRPAIGKRWIQRWWRDVYPRDYVVINGYESKPPRYYDKFMDLEDKKGGTPERRELMETVRDKRYEEAKDLTKYQLAAGEKIRTSQINLYQARDQV